MTESKHTPGPWIVFNGDGSFGVLPAGRPGLIAECKNTHDASLIAAAPDMLEVLKIIREWRDVRSQLASGHVQDVIDALDAITGLADATIAKAESQP
jgi:hypothetical protein